MLSGKHFTHSIKKYNGNISERIYIGKTLFFVKKRNTILIKPEMIQIKQLAKNLEKLIFFSHKAFKNL